MSQNPPAGLRYAIADPPYLGRARRWYGTGRGHQNGLGRAAAHEHADEWDNPATHQRLVADLVAGYDGWAIAASVDSLAVYLPVCPPDTRVLVWHKGNAIPSGSRIAGQWEPVIVWIPPDRRGRTGQPVSDVLTAGVSHRHRYIGSKPYLWTRWVLTTLGYHPEHDQLHDLFPGSGAVTIAAEHQPTTSSGCAVCGAPTQQPATGRPRKTCSDACRTRLHRRRPSVKTRKREVNA